MQILHYNHRKNPGLGNKTLLPGTLESYLSPSLEKCPLLAQVNSLWFFPPPSFTTDLPICHLQISQKGHKINLNFCQTGSAPAPPVLFLFQHFLTLLQLAGYVCAAWLMSYLFVGPLGRGTSGKYVKKVVEEDQFNWFSES